MLSPLIPLANVDQHPVWILSTTAAGAPTSVFTGDLLWWDPCIVRYDCDNSFEVIETPDSRLRPNNGDPPPDPWGVVTWDTIQGLCFRGNPRRLARYRHGRPAFSDVPGLKARKPQEPEETATTPPPSQPVDNDSAIEPPPKKKKETPLEAPASPPTPPKTLSSSSPTELLSTYAAGGRAIFSDTLELNKSQFSASSSFADDIIKASIKVESYQPESTKESYKAAVARFLDYIRTAEVEDKAFLNPATTERILIGFFVSRIGEVPALATKLHWRAVAPATAKTEVAAVITALRLIGLPPPAFSSLHTVFKKSGAFRKAPHSEKLPLFANNLDRMWRSLPEVKTEAISVRNFALCTTTYFFMLRGGEGLRDMRRGQ